MPRTISVAAERLAFVQHEIDVVEIFRMPLRARDAGERDEADHRGDRERLARRS